MLTLLLGFVVAFAAMALTSLWLGPWWVALVGVLAFVAVTIPLNLWVKKRLEAVFAEVQTTVEATQDQLRRKITMMQNKNVSGGKGLQRRMEKEQAAGIREALKILERVRPLRR